MGDMFREILNVEQPPTPELTKESLLTKKRVNSEKYVWNFFVYIIFSFFFFITDQRQLAGQRGCTGKYMHYSTKTVKMLLHYFLQTQVSMFKIAERCRN